VRIIEFDGYGRPKIPDVSTGTIALLLQEDELSIVRIELLPPDEYGPSLDHAINNDELVAEAWIAVRHAFPKGLSKERHWVLSCPPDIARRARFPS
jgi:hypothetical protein